MTDPTRGASRQRSRPLRVWWSLTALALVLGVGSFAIGDVAAQKPESSSKDASIVVDSVDATGDRVVLDGSLIGASPDSIELSSDGERVVPDKIEAASDGALRNEVVAVIDNADSLGNATVQLAKQALDPLMPGAGASSTLGVVATGGGASVEVGPTGSPSQVVTGLEGVSPVGISSTWDGLTRASELLQDRDPGSVGTIVLFSASPETIDPTAASRASSAMRAAGVRLEVVAMPLGTDVATLQEMVGDLGGSMSTVSTDEELAGAFNDVAASLAGGFRISFPPLGDADSLVPLTLEVGDLSQEIAYAPDSIRVGSVELAPVAGGGGRGVLASPIMKWLILFLGVTAAIMLVWAVVSILMPDENNLNSRLEAYDESYGAEPVDPRDAPAETMSMPIIKRAVEFTGEMAERRGVLDKVEVMLERANMPLRAPEAMFFTAALAALLVVLTFFVTGNILVAAVVAIVAAFLPSAVLNFRIRKRQKAFLRQLPDMLTMLAGTLRAGYSIGQGFESVSTEVHDPMGRELRRVVSETRLGRSLEESLEAVADRMDSDDFSWAVMAIRIQREVGGNLAELLLTVADTMTQRERLRREVSTLTAEGRMSAIIIGLLPPVLAGVMFVLNPEYIKELFSPGLGYALLAGAVVMMGIGFAWMKKTITIEV